MSYVSTEQAFTGTVHNTTSATVSDVRVGPPVQRCRAGPHAQAKPSAAGAVRRQAGCPRPIVHDLERTRRAGQRRFVKNLDRDERQTQRTMSRRTARDVAIGRLQRRRGPQPVRRRRPRRHRRGAGRLGRLPAVPVTAARPDPAVLARVLADPHWFLVPGALPWRVHAPVRARRARCSVGGGAARRARGRAAVGRGRRLRSEHRRLPHPRHPSTPGCGQRAPPCSTPAPTSTTTSA